MCRMHRLQKIKDIRWDLHTAVLPEGVKENLSTNEAAFFEAYHQILSEYMDSVGLDLTVVCCWNVLALLFMLTVCKDLKTPPKDLFIEVRVKSGGGSIVTDRGNTLVLDPNTTHFVRRSDVEALIRQGVLEHV